MKRVALLLVISACATTSTPGAAPPARDVTELVTLEGDRIIVRESLSFEHGKSEVSPTSTDLLDAVAKILTDNPAIGQLTIVGHADASGEPANNLPLSLARAKAVKAYLETKGIEPTRLTAQGVGADVPLDTNDTDQGRARNRRVEFKVSK